MDTMHEIAAIKAATKATDALRRAVDTLHTRYDGLVAERHRVAYAPPSRPEVLATTERLVVEAATRGLADRGHNITRTLAGSREPGFDPLTGADARDRVKVPRLPDVTPMHGAALTMADLCFWLPDLMAARLRAVVMAQPDSAFGPPSAERPGLLAELARQIAEVERQHTEVVESAGDAGITLALLPAVVERRRLEQEERERQERRQQSLGEEPRRDRSFTKVRNELVAGQ